jgi:phosphohistidine phosphatase
MRLLIIRHGGAGDRETFAKQTGKPDEQRPLTKDGRRRMRVNARGLCNVVPKLDAIATSPLKRARQTARIVARAYGTKKPAKLKALAPGGSRRGVLAWARKHANGKRGVVALVGHEPDLGELAMWLSAGNASSALAFKKGGAALIEVPASRPRRGQLIWMLTPRQLRAFARC